METPQAADGRFTATVIDRTGGSRSRNFSEYKAAGDWLAGRADDADLAGRAAVGAVITGPGSPPLVLMDPLYAAPGAAANCLDPVKARWTGRRPERTTVVRTDGSMLVYCSDRTESGPDGPVSRRMAIDAVIYPENPAVLTIDVGPGPDIMAVAGPGSCVVMRLCGWRMRHTGPPLKRES